jgi:hypothetical protein
MEVALGCWSEKAFFTNEVNCTVQSIKEEMEYVSIEQILEVFDQVFQD